MPMNNQALKLPHEPWFLMGVTAPFCLQSIESGSTVTFSYLKVVVLVFEKRMCPLNLFLGTMNSSLVRSAN